ncbi:hypothetical protein D3P07_15930 [Paenibacillus sp. 1011MAR3C5]|uniref:hypothetical protein n=1 Tax=Paenibacillus sp. 1011MAR3C5 TaxID=1675787 RepID=UPI000E6CB659|nr:hypothetical protein [Paenibacillus sp. 1011MAR3C5]RJE86678.1 hypothetical protein D3P07_15930 [Paenibacillus sp. 1011MAR3C5]
MRLVLKRTLVGAMILFFILVAGLNNWDVLYGRYVAHSFFSNLTAGSLEAAAKNMYFDEEDGTDNWERSGAGTAWIKRVQDLREQGVHAVSYKNLRVQNDDSSPVGRVTLTIEEQGEPRDYQVVFFFKGSLADFGIARFQQIDELDGNPEWQEALSGAY